MSLKEVDERKIGAEVGLNQQLLRARRHQTLHRHCECACSECAAGSGARVRSFRYLRICFLSRFANSPLLFDGAKERVSVIPLFAGW